MYTGLLYNIATGLYTNLIRVLMAFCCTLLIMPRLDKNLFVKPFEKLDSGQLDQWLVVTDVIIIINSSL